MPHELVEYIKNKVSIIDVVSRRVKLRRVGRDWFGCCPFHKEKTPSFKADPDSGYYYCFGCGARGDIFNFIMETEKMTFSEALEYLANANGIPVPKKSSVPIDPHKKEYDALEMIKSRFSKNLFEPCGADAKKYLENRKISSESMKKFQLGFSPADDSLLSFLRNEKISDETLIKAGVFYKGQYNNKMHNRYEGRIIFPILNASGKCIGFGGRVFGSNAKKDISKYINSPESEIYVKNQNLYGFSLAKKGKSKDIIFVEGYLDVVSMHEAGFDRTVAPLGTSISDIQINMCWKICDTPIIMLDGDNAGIKASYRWIEKILPILQPGKSFKFARLPQDTDPDSLIYNGRTDVIHEAIKNAVSLSDWLWQGAFILYPSETPEQKASVIKMITEKVELIRDSSLKKLYTNEMRENERNLYRNKFKKTENKITNIQPVISANEKFEKILIVSVINHPYILDKIIESFTNIEFKLPIANDLKNRILDCYTRYFLNEKFEDYCNSVKELKKQIESSVSDIILHAGFIDENEPDESVTEGWKKIYEQYSFKPEVDKDLQNASSSLKSSFSESDWERLKSLKKESLLIKQ